jgi:integration host factor subunit beta
MEGEGCMLKSGLVRRIKEQNLHLHLSDVERLADAILDEIEAALVRRDRVELRGFGAFFVKTRSARPGRNPKNGATVSMPERLHPVFKTGKGMHRRLNGTAGSDLRAAFHKGSNAATIDPKA